MRHALLKTSVATALIFGASVASAGNLAEPIIPEAPAPIPAPVVVSNDWTGFYAGGSLGYADVTEESGAFDDTGTTYGLHAGYDYDFGSFVLGGELEVSGFDVSDGGIDVDSVARAKVRAGYDAGNVLPYLAAGVAQLNTGSALEADDTGVFYGAGVDYMLSDSLRVGGEVLQHEFDEFNGSALNLDATTASVRMSFQF